MGTGMAILVTAGFVVVAIAAFVGFVLLRKRGKSPEWQFVLGAVTAVVLAAVVIVASTSATSPATASQPSKEDVQQQRTDALFAALRVHQFDTTGTGQYDAQFSLDGKSGSVEVGDYTHPMLASLRYDPAEPYAVQLTFHDAEGGPVRWLIDRQQLADSFDGPAGIGDIRLWPWTTVRGAVIAMALTSPDGSALFELSREDVRSFLQRAYAAVPRGRESDYVNVDNWIAEIFK